MNPLPVGPPVAAQPTNNAFNLGQGLGGHKAVGGFGGNALAGGMPKTWNTQV
jgi:hypothetical protein